eukprot:CAMPEP_0196586026 /NCGR_PEP_ID=MMETSP1081-20130531/52886_1 /TAXON_ID=36882 /ORGANISM="Pyramimonas amylifera, Strain CCMP720" /LENGTH=198 /DNA_ID=CAMNT_0041907761 /DNA_START=455 /DNA_END=1051 /DNA_ORIENTATION=-
MYGKGITCQVVLKEALTAAGLYDNLADLKILEVGCNAGNKLAALVALGCAPCNLYGVDLSSKSLAIAKENLPEEVHLKHVAVEAPFDYTFEEVPQFDLVFCCSTLPHVPLESRVEFLEKPKKLGARYFMLHEAWYSEPLRKEWFGWIFHFDDWLQVAKDSSGLGDCIYKKNLELVHPETKEMFAPLSHDLLAVFQVAF